MDLVKLQYFLEVARLENMTSAAENLNISQPALSAVITKMERELDHPLFNRVGRGIVLSEYGAILKKHATSILNEYNLCLREMENIQQSSPSTITVGLAGIEYAKRIIIDFSRYFPNVHVNQALLREYELNNRSNYTHLDFLILPTQLNDDTMEGQLLYNDSQFALVPSTHPLSSRESISMAELAKEVFVLMTPGHMSRKLTIDMCRKAGFTPKSIIDAINSQIIPFVQAGLGISIVGITSSLEPHPSLAGLNLIPIEDDFCQKPVYLYWRKNCIFSTEAKLFKSFVLNNKEKFLQEGV